MIKKLSIIFFLLTLNFFFLTCKKKAPQNHTKSTCALTNIPISIRSSVTTYLSFCGNTNDLSNNNNNGTLINGQYTIDRFGNSNNAIVLNSSSSIVSTNKQYVNPQNFTISVWIKTSVSNYSRVVVFDESKQLHGWNWDRSITIENGKASFYVHPGSVKLISGGKNINDNKWHHLAASIGLDGMKLYVDGKIVAFDNSIKQAQVFNGYWRVGGFENTTPIGSFDDFTVFNKTLTQSEVLELFQQ
jgi:hypothetical protein